MYVFWYNFYDQLTVQGPQLVTSGEYIQTSMLILLFI